jgi:hypothetical protein
MVRKFKKSFFIKKIGRHGPAGFEGRTYLNFQIIPFSHIFMLRDTNNGIFYFLEGE